LSAGKMRRGVTLRGEKKNFKGGEGEGGYPGGLKGGKVAASKESTKGQQSNDGITQDMDKQGEKGWRLTIYERKKKDRPRLGVVRSRRGATVHERGDKKTE